MKPSAFEYSRPTSLGAALNELAAGGKPLAGGQSLGPMMNLRVARPGRLIEISRLSELRERRESEDAITFGACLTHAEIEDGGADPTRGFLTHVASRIAYRVVRNRGTMGGSLSHADPAADWLTSLTAAGATLRLEKRSGARQIDIRDFVLGAYTTALDADEILTAIAVPRVSAEARWGYAKLCRKVGELADAIGAVVIDAPRRYARVVAGSVGGAPLLLPGAARTVAETARAPDMSALTAELARLAPSLDAVKRQQVAVSLERAFAEALK